MDNTFDKKIDFFKALFNTNNLYDIIRSIPDLVYSDNLAYLSFLLYSCDKISCFTNLEFSTLGKNLLKKDIVEEFTKKTIVKKDIISKQNEGRFLFCKESIGNSFLKGESYKDTFCVNSKTIKDNSLYMLQVYSLEGEIINKNKLDLEGLFLIRQGDGRIISIPKDKEINFEFKNYIKR